MQKYDGMKHASLSCLKRIFLLILLVCSVLFFGCSRKAEAQVATKEIFAMDTYMDLICYGSSAEDAIYRCEEEIKRLSGLFDAVSGEGDIAIINRDTTATVSDDTITILQEAKTLSKLTGHSFHALIRPLVSLWGFTGETPQVPEEKAIASLLPLPDTDTISISDKTVSIPEGSSIDLGGIAKGYLSDRLAELIRSSGVSSALLSLGGNVMAVGTKEDGSNWNIGIQDPKDTSGVIGVVSVHDMAVITSGSYQRYFEENGKVYHHILDPKTGYPSESGLVSVTVVSKNGTSADALSTAFFVLGTDESLSVLSNLPDAYRPDGVIFIKEDGSIQVWGNISFHAMNENQKVEVIS